MSGYGQTGPFRSFLGYGPPASALSGLFGLTGYAGGEPAEIGVSYPDPNAGLMGAYAVIVALLHRDLTGEGQYIDQSQWEAVLAHMAEGLLEWDMHQREPARNGNHDRFMAPHETYKALGDDDKWVSIAVGTEEEWHALCQRDGPARARHRRAVRAGRAAQAERGRPRRDHHRVDERARPVGRGRDAAAGGRGRVPVDEQQGPRRGSPPRPSAATSCELEHPVVGRRIHAGIPWTMSGDAVRRRSTPPRCPASTPTRSCNGCSACRHRRSTRYAPPRSSASPPAMEVRGERLCGGPDRPTARPPH